MEGNPIPLFGGIVVAMQRFDRIVEIRPSDFVAVVEAGVGYKELNRAVGCYGLFFPPDPGAAATIGGMIANNASGVRTVKYGATKDYVLKLTVVLADGEIIETGSLATKSSSGYDLARLFVGSEGTLGIITQAIMRLAGLPAHFSAALATFPTLEGAAHAVFEIMRQGLSPAALELLTTEVVALLNRVVGWDFERSPPFLWSFTVPASLLWRRSWVRCKSSARRLGRPLFKRGWESRNETGCGRLAIRPLKASNGPIQDWPPSLRMLRSLSLTTPKSSNTQGRWSAITEW